MGRRMAFDQADQTKTNCTLPHENNCDINCNAIFVFFGTEPKTVSSKRDRDGVSHKSGRGLPDSEKNRADWSENKPDIQQQTMRAKWAIFRPHFGGLQPQTPGAHGLIRSRVTFRVTQFTMFCNKKIQGHLQIFWENFFKNCQKMPKKIGSTLGGAISEKWANVWKCLPCI